MGHWWVTDVIDAEFFAPHSTGFCHLSRCILRITQVDDNRLQFA
jgi:hypothetical protein